MMMRPGLPEEADLVLQELLKRTVELAAELRPYGAAGGRSHRR
ncbi:MAG TPA: hypothetical protein VF168_14265 [Trueperaceae bacterium]